MPGAVMELHTRNTGVQHGGGHHEVTTVMADRFPQSPTSFSSSDNDSCRPQSRRVTQRSSRMVSPDNDMDDVRYAFDQLKLDRSIFGRSSQVKNRDTQSSGTQPNSHDMSSRLGNGFKSGSRINNGESWSFNSMNSMSRNTKESDIMATEKKRMPHSVMPTEDNNKIQHSVSPKMGTCGIENDSPTSDLSDRTGVKDNLLVSGEPRIHRRSNSGTHTLVTCQDTSQNEHSKDENRHAEITEVHEERPRCVPWHSIPSENVKVERNTRLAEDKSADSAGSSRVSEEARPERPKSAHHSRFRRPRFTTSSYGRGQPDEDELEEVVLGVDEEAGGGLATARHSVSRFSRPTSADSDYGMVTTTGVPAWESYTSNDYEDGPGKPTALDIQTAELEPHNKSGVHLRMASQDMNDLCNTTYPGQGVSLRIKRKYLRRMPSDDMAKTSPSPIDISCSPPKHGNANHLSVSMATSPAMSSEQAAERVVQKYRQRALSDKTPLNVLADVHGNKDLKAEKPESGVRIRPVLPRKLRPLLLRSSTEDSCTSDLTDQSTAASGGGSESISTLSTNNPPMHQTHIFKSAQHVQKNKRRLEPLHPSHMRGSSLPSGVIPMQIGLQLSREGTSVSDDSPLRNAASRPVAKTDFNKTSAPHDLHVNVPSSQQNNHEISMTLTLTDGLSTRTQGSVFDEGVKSSRSESDTLTKRHQFQSHDRSPRHLAADTSLMRSLSEKNNRRKQLKNADSRPRVASLSGLEQIQLRRHHKP